MNHVSPGVFRQGRGLFTVNFVPGTAHFEEQLLRLQGREFRSWDPRTSKLAASIIKGVPCPIRQDSSVLYLGASHGYTCSFVSDIACSGRVFAVDFAPRVVRDLVFVAEKRSNLFPILGDCRNPGYYYHYVDAADVIFQDIAQRDQVGVFIRNASFLKQDGHAYLAVKARSIDVSREPRRIFQEARQELEQHFKILSYVTLDPFQKDHCMFLCRRR